VEVLLVVLALELLLAPDGEHIVIETDIDVLLGDSRQLRRDANFVVRLRTFMLALTKAPTSLCPWLPDAAGRPVPRKTSSNRRFISR